MHAYLIIGQTKEAERQVEKLAKKLRTKTLEFPIQKIEDARNLNALIRLSFDEPTLIVGKDINNATEEALNAFLKNLEEPQENIYFALTTPSLRKVMPTIISRCQIIQTNSEARHGQNYEDIEKFLSLTKVQKLAYTDKIRDRAKAIDFAENTVLFLHSKLHENQVKYGSLGRTIEVATQTLARLKANGNVSLQLANMVIQL